MQPSLIRHARYFRQADVTFPSCTAQEYHHNILSSMCQTQVRIGKPCPHSVLMHYHHLSKIVHKLLIIVPVHTSVQINDRGGALVLLQLQRMLDKLLITR